jgi:hypothetical protein
MSEEASEPRSLAAYRAKAATLRIMPSCESTPYSHEQDSLIVP